MKEKEFYKAYNTNYKNFKVFKELSGTDYCLLNVFLSKTEYCNSDKAYGGQTFSISTKCKKELCEEFDISATIFERTIRKLVSGGIIRRIEDKRGMYQVNPFCYAFGGEADVDKFRALCLKNEWFRDTDVKPSKLIRTEAVAKIVSIESKAAEKRVADRAINRMFAEG